MGKFLIFCRIQLKFCSWLYKKCWHTSCKFQFEKTSNKKVIAKKPLTNIYEMNSTKMYLYIFRSVPHTRSTKASLIRWPWPRDLRPCCVVMATDCILYICGAVMWIRTMHSLRRQKSHSGFLWLLNKFCVCLFTDKKNKTTWIYFYDSVFHNIVFL